MFERFFRRKAPAGQYPAPIADARATTLPPIPMRVSMIIHNPILPGGARLNQYMGWHDPDRLVQQYIDDLRACSGGLARYEIVERIEVDGYPIKIDGFSYNNTTYLNCWQQRGGFHNPDAVNYNRLLTEFDLISKVERHQIDEVWLFAFPYAGYYESTMVGADAFWCNSPPVPHTDHCQRRFVIMGFNFERDVGCMIENFGHRVESIMTHVYRHRHGGRNLWARFTRYDRDTPGQAECGNVHFAPSSRADYDWGNRRAVLSRADAWYNFPDLSLSPRPMTCAEWGNGDMRAHHLWWLDHIPRVAGVTDGISNNWWQYVLLVDQTP
ncbi:MAG: hypothetical protein MI924_29255 [Chloroflexales bacterium]|nr:hypothetical protein [Chloroflexales bacterium]